MDWSQPDEIRGYGYGLMLAREVVARQLQHQEFMVLPNMRELKEVAELLGHDEHPRMQFFCNEYLKDLKERNGAIQELYKALYEIEDFIETTEQRLVAKERELYPEEYEDEL